MTRDFLQIAGKALELADEASILNSLADFVGKLPDLRSNGLAGSALHILKEVASGEGNIETATREALQALIARNPDLAAAGVGVLIESLTSLAAGTATATTCRWPLVKARPSGQAGPVALAVSAEVALTLAADRSEALWPYSDAPGEFLLLAGVEAKADAKAGLAAPFGAARIGVDASADANFGLEWLFDPADEKRGLPVALLMAEQLPHLANPFSLIDVHQAVEAGNLVGLRMTAHGGARIKATLSIGFSEDIGGIKLSGGPEVSIGASISSDYELSLRAVRPRAAGGAHAIAVKASRKAISTTSIGASLGVTIDLSELTARLRGIITAKIGLAQAELAKIGEWLSPAEKLRPLLQQELGQAVAAVLGDSALAKAIKDNLEAVIGTGTPEGLNSFVEGQLAGLLDRAGTRGTTEINGLVATILSSLPHPLAAMLDTPALRAKLAAPLTGLITGLRQRIDTAVTGLAGPALAGLDKLLADADLAVDAAANAITSRLEKLHALFARIEGLAGKIVAEVNDPLRRQISLKIAVTESFQKSEGLKIAGQFNAFTADTERLHRAIFTGNWDALAPLFAGQDIAGFTLDRSLSQLTLGLSRERNASVHAVVFGFGTEFTARDLASAEISIDGFGNITVSTKAEIAKRAKVFGPNKAVGMISTMAVAVAATSSNVTAADLGFVASTSDRRLRKRDVRQFLASIQPLGMAGGPGEADRLLAEWFGNGENSSVNATAGVRLTLTKDALLALRALGRRQFDEPGLRAELVGRAIAIMRARERPRRHDAALAIVRDFVNAGPGVSDAAAWLDFLDRQRLDSLAKVQRWRGGPGDSFFSSTIDNGIDEAQWEDAVSGLYRAALVSKFVDAICRTVDHAASATPTTLREVLQHVWEQQQILIDIGDDWLRVNDTVLDWFNDRVSDRVVTSLLILLDLIRHQLPADAAVVQFFLSESDGASRDAALALN